MSEQAAKTQSFTQLVKEFPNNHLLKVEGKKVYQHIKPLTIQQRFDFDCVPPVDKDKDLHKLAQASPVQHSDRSATSQWGPCIDGQTRNIKTKKLAMKPLKKERKIVRSHDELAQAPKHHHRWTCLSGAPSGAPLHCSIAVTFCGDCNVPDA